MHRDVVNNASSNKFDIQLKRMIETFSSEHFIFKLERDFACSCTNYLSKQANPSCKKCLGLGYKSTMYKKNLAIFEGQSSSSDSSSSFSSKGSMMNISIYANFTDPVILDGDIVVVDGSVYEIYSSTTLSHFKSQKSYQKFLAVYKKNQNKIRDNINEFINKSKV